jgi:putative SOS response-associated peptidase YedK
MCGRYASTRSAADLVELFGEALDPDHGGVQDLTGGTLRPDYNIAPTDPAPIVRLSRSQAGPVLSVARWGYVPPWARDPVGPAASSRGAGSRAGTDRRSAARMINARAETVASSPAYRDAFARRRCLVPADGWYEWHVEGSGGTRAPRRPYFMTRPGLVVFGGIWSPGGAADDASLTFGIVTFPAVGQLATIHDRMPMVLDPSRWVQWLDGAGAADVLAPPTSEYCEGFEIRPVSPAVGDVRKDGPELLQRVALPKQDMSTVDQSPTLF